MDLEHLTKKSELLGSRIQVLSRISKSTDRNTLNRVGKLALRIYSGLGEILNDLISNRGQYSPQNRKYSDLLTATIRGLRADTVALVRYQQV